jgi:hypothetical protein
MDDETDVTEITILPDGRVYVFGLSGQVLEVLQTLQTGDERVQRLLATAGAVSADVPGLNGGGWTNG